MARKFAFALLILANVVCRSGDAQNFWVTLVRAVESIVPAKKDSLMRQMVKGQVVDHETKFPLPAAHVTLMLENGTLMRLTSTSLSGSFQFDNVVVGRYKLVVSHVGYYRTEEDILVSSSSEVRMQVPLEFYYEELGPIEVRAGESDRDIIPPDFGDLIEPRKLEIIPGTLDDATRTIKNVHPNPPLDDSRNDVVVRGNSPGSVLWRLEGINIINPNHFSIPGTSGGPVSMISNKVLAPSDFYSGAFPAEFGNTVSGIFDLRLRNGSDERHNWNFQYGILGMDLTHEGPISCKRKSSYLVHARRSVLGNFQSMGVDVGIDATPVYYDGSFKVNFPMKNNASLSFFGMGGRSRISILISKGHKNFYGERDRDQYFRTRSGVAGLRYEHPINKATSFFTTLAISGEQALAKHDLVKPSPDVNDLLELNGEARILQYDFQETRFSHAIKLTRKFERSIDSTRKWSSIIKAGVITDYYRLSYLDSAVNINGQPGTNSEFGMWRVRWLHRGNALLIQPYLEWKYTRHKIDLLAGIHSQYFSISSSYSPLEPRLAIKYHINEERPRDIQNIYASAGLHSQMQSPYLYFYGSANATNQKPIPENRSMDFTRSVHTSIGYERLIGWDSARIRLKTELYYQYLYNVPVTQQNSSFSLVNTGATFTRLYPEALMNEGVGKNYGVEVSVSRYLFKGYLLIVNGTLFQSRYKGSDNVWRSTTFDSNYAMNAILSYEWVTKRKNIISLGGRSAVAGGRRHGYVDVEESQDKREIIYQQPGLNELKFKMYFRTDVRFSYKHNRPRVTHEIAIDFINITFNRNILRHSFDPALQGSVATEYQFGFVPVFYYRFSRSNFNADERRQETKRILDRHLQKKADRKAKKG